MDMEIKLKHIYFGTNRIYIITKNKGEMKQVYKYSMYVYIHK